jgi:mono/diheme cytochrome c family protein
MRNSEQMMILSRARSRRQRRSYLPFNALVAVVIALGLQCAHASATQADTADTGAAGETVKQGDEIFHKRCVVCHNKKPGDNTPFGPPNLYTVFRSHPTTITPAQAETIVMNGRGQMPSFKAVLTRTEIRSVIAYLRSH